MEATPQLVADASSPTLLAVNNYHYLRGGADAVFFEEARLLGEMGWSVVPFSMQHEQNLPSEWSSFFVSEIEFGQDYGPLEKVSKGLKSVYSFEAQSKLRALMNEVQPDVVHMHNIYHHLSPSILSVISEAGVPAILTLHDLKLACPAYKMLRNGGPCEDCKGGKTFNVVRNRCVKGSLALSGLVYFETMLHKLLHFLPTCLLALVAKQFQPLVHQMLFHKTVPFNRDLRPNLVDEVRDDRR